MADIQREHYMKDEQICDLFKSELESFLPLPREPFRVFTLEKVTTDKRSFIHFYRNPYSTAPEYCECEMWLEIGTSEIRILNEKFELVDTHIRKCGKQTEPIINFDNYIGALSRKPRFEAS
jgi:hypothetical protein